MPFLFFTKRFLTNLIGFGTNGDHKITANNLQNVAKDFDSVEKVLPTDEQKAAMDGANSPSKTNPFATLTDIPASATPFISSVSSTGNDVTLSVTTGALSANLASTNISQFTNDSGYITAAGATPNLDAVLGVGNTTGGQDIVVSTGDSIYGQTDLFLSEANGDNYYYAGPNYIFQQWYDPIGGDTDYLLQGGGTQLYSSQGMAIQSDTGQYNFYEGAAFDGILDFTNLTAHRTFDFPNASGTVALVIPPSATTGTLLGFTPNASANNVFNESTFSGGSGTAYTLNDIVLALKAANILAP